MEMIPNSQEFHLSIRVADLGRSTAFYRRFGRRPTRTKTHLDSSFPDRASHGRAESVRLRPNRPRRGAPGHHGPRV
jgi:hypothetical protein